jgi:molecular chaperone IbpA
MKLDYRARTVGFDAFFEHLAAASTPTYPPYNIVRTKSPDRNRYDRLEVQVAVAGFREDDLLVETKGGKLTIRSNPDRQSSPDVEYIHRGIAEREFALEFSLATNVLVRGAEIRNGLLVVSIDRVIPEADKPVTIPIKSGRQVLNG